VLPEQWYCSKRVAVAASGWPQALGTRHPSVLRGACVGAFSSPLANRAHPAPPSHPRPPCRLAEDRAFLLQAIPEHPAEGELDWELIARHFGRCGACLCMWPCVCCAALRCAVLRGSASLLCHATSLHGWRLTGLGMWWLGKRHGLQKFATGTAC